jgi:membrane protease YdiL (CAAX protease family)
MIYHLLSSQLYLQLQVKVRRKINKMTFIPNFNTYWHRTPLIQLFVSFLIVLVIGLLLFSLLILAGSMISGVDSSLIGDPSFGSGIKETGFIRYTLVAQDISFFIVPAIIILTKFNPGHQKGILNIKTISINDLILVVILAFCAFPVTSLAGQINSQMALPDQLSGLEQWMRDKEDYANHLMDLLMTPGTILGMCMNVLIIACIPAIGEELIFRGVFQKLFQNLFRSGHISVLLTSFIFSAIHFQFYGFLPRFFLGLIFGYLFLWTRNLWLPITAHFINNAVPTVWSYLRGWETINEKSSASLTKQTTIMILSLIAGTIILAYFKKRSTAEVNENPVI